MSSTGARRGLFPLPLPDVRMTRFAFIATILMVASGCDKARELGAAGRREIVEEPSDRLDLASRPEILFQVFGERDDPRMIPIATVRGGTLAPINLGTAGWRAFDSLYARSGATATIYHDGYPLGTATVRQGMWEKPGAPLYSLPGCRLLTPLAAVSITGAPTDGYTVEYLASTAKLAERPRLPPLPKADAAKIGRAVGASVGKSAGLSSTLLDSLDFFVAAIRTGAGSEPTVVASFIDPTVQNDTSATSRTAHIFLVADKGTGGQHQATYDHTVNGPAAHAHYRRYIDHLDLNGDGVDEIVLEGWQYGGDTQLLVLSWKDGRWTETFRGRPNWCLDRR